jgi:tetratricopeptide (TPR) repeat protein
MFESWRRTAGSMETDLAEDRARDAAKVIGAGQIILGSIAGNEQRLTMNAELVRVRDGSVIVGDTVVGPIDSLFPMTSRLTSKLLALREGASRERLRTILSAQPAAITSFLNGEGLYRRGRYFDAARQFAESYRIDSSFALAALRVSSSNGWIPGRPLPGAWLARAHRHRSRLTGNDSLLLEALAGTGYPKPVPQREHLDNMWRIANRASSAELWYAAGDALYHGGVAAGFDDAKTRALQAFKNAEAIDSSYAGGLEHQSTLYLGLGDTARAREVDRRQARIDSTGDYFIISHAITSLALARPDERAAIAQRILVDLDDPAPFIAAWAATAVEGTEPDLSLAEAVFSSPTVARRPFGNSVSAAMLRDTYFNTGRVAEVAKVYPPDSTPSGQAHELLHAMFWDGDTVRALTAAARIDRWRATARDTTGTPDDNLPRLARALWAVEHGDTTTARRIREELTQFRAPPDRPWLGNTTLLYGKLLDARLAVTAKAGNAKAMLTELDSILIDMPRIERRDARVIGNLLIAGMWEEVGEPRRALQASRRRDMQYAFTAYASTFLRLNARVAEAAGEREEAIRSLRTYIALRANAEPALKADVEAAKQNLARLEAASRGR